MYDTWIVMEIQSNGAQLAVAPPTVHDSWNDALASFYQKMVSVAQSSVPEHTVLIMDKVGQVRKIETVYHNEVTE